MRACERACVRACERASVRASVRACDWLSGGVVSWELELHLKLHSELLYAE